MRKIGKITQIGDKRIRSIFLLFPITERKNSGTRETRWLEWATIEEVYTSGWDGSSWDFVRFVNP